MLMKENFLSCLGRNSPFLPFAPHHRKNGFLIILIKHTIAISIDFYVTKSFTVNANEHLIGFKYFFSEHLVSTYHLITNDD